MNKKRERVLVIYTDTHYYECYESWDDKSEEWDSDETIEYDLSISHCPYPWSGGSDDPMPMEVDVSNYHLQGTPVASYVLWINS